MAFSILTRIRDLGPGRDLTVNNSVLDPDSMDQVNSDPDPLDVGS